jgi:biopolymer transport protein ExbB
MIDLYLKGGWVMHAILLCSVAALGVAIERAIYFLRIRSDDQGFFEKLRTLLQGGKISEAVTLCRQARGPVASSLRACVENLDKGPAGAEGAVSHRGSEALTDMERHLRILAVVAQATPLMGLLGTVIGMIKAFMKIEEVGGRVNPAALAGGVWEALLTTAFGLIVAIPAMFAYHYFVGKVDDYEKDIHRYAHDIVNISPDSLDAPRAGPACEEGSARGV